MTTTGPGVREPMSGNPIPANLIDLVIVPGLGFTEAGYRIGDRLLYHRAPMLRGDDVATVQRRLSALGFEPGQPTIPSPHVHNYHQAFDNDARDVLAHREWIHTPLRPEDEQ